MQIQDRCKRERATAADGELDRVANPALIRPFGLELPLEHIGCHRPDAGLLHHSDQARPTQARVYQRLLDAYGVTCSMSRRGDCCDKAVMEAFFSSLKNELADRFDSCGEAKMELFDYVEIEVFLHPAAPAFDAWADQSGRI